MYVSNIPSAKEFDHRIYLASFPGLVLGPGNKAIHLSAIELICETILHYIIHFRMAKVHERSLAAVYTAVSGEA